jgi:hypothetical protein
MAIVDLSAILYHVDARAQAGFDCLTHGFGVLRVGAACGHLGHQKLQKRVTTRSLKRSPVRWVSLQFKIGVRRCCFVN